MNTYLIKAKKSGLCMVASYEEGHLKKLVIDINQPLNEAQIQKIPGILPFSEDKVKTLPTDIFNVTMEAQIQDKAAIWCKVYNAKLPTHYKLSGREVGMLKHVTVTEELVTAFMDCPEWWAKPKSVGNYVKHPNELAVYMAQKPSEIVKKWPDEWSESYQAKLSGSEMTAWWQHLRNLGLKPIKNRLGKTIKWEKPI